jgi:arginyl-tRNA synthetase
MATLSSDGLQALLGGVGVESPIPPFLLADLQSSPMGIYVSYLAEILVQLTECEPQVAYQSIQWPNDLGDLAVVLPRLRLKDVDPNDLAVELKKRVGLDVHFSCSPSQSV